MKLISIYFVMSRGDGRFYRRGYLEDLPENIIDYLDNGYMVSIWDVTGKYPDKMVDELPYGTHPSFAFNETCRKLDLGDYV